MTGDILVKMFRSPKTREQMLEALRLRAPDFDWTARESEYRGSYLFGETSAGVKVRVTEEDGTQRVELEFPASGGRLPDAEKRGLTALLESEILPALGAA